MICRAFQPGAKFRRFADGRPRADRTYIAALLNPVVAGRPSLTGCQNGVSQPVKAKVVFLTQKAKAKPKPKKLTDDGAEACCGRLPCC